MVSTIAASSPRAPATTMSTPTPRPEEGAGSSVVSSTSGSTRATGPRAQALARELTRSVRAWPESVSVFSPWMNIVGVPETPALTDAAVLSPIQSR